jgi:hypothetical protein
VVVPEGLPVLLQPLLTPTVVNPAERGVDGEVEVRSSH